MTLPNTALKMSGQFNINCILLPEQKPLIKQSSMDQLRQIITHQREKITKETLLHFTLLTKQHIPSQQQQDKETRLCIHLIRQTSQLATLHQNSLLATHFPSQLPLPISTAFLAQFSSTQQLLAALKSIISSLYLQTLLDIHQELHQNNQSNQQQPYPPRFGAKDLKSLHTLAQSICNWSIYNQLNQPIIQHPPKLPATLSFYHIIQSLTRIILPSPTSNPRTSLTPSDFLLDPRLELHHALFSTLFLPLMAGIIKLKLDPTTSDWATLHLNQLLDLADPKLVFSSLFSLFTALNSKAIIKPNETVRNDRHELQQQTHEFRLEISQILSTRLLRPYGLIALLQSLITEDYHDEDHDHDHDHDAEQGEKRARQRSTITSATLKRFESIYYILSHPPSSIPPSDYWGHILKNLIETIIPEFFHDGLNKDRLGTARDPIRKTACFVLSQIIARQVAVYRAYLSPIIHSAFRPPASSKSPGQEEDRIVVSSAKLNQTIQLLNQLVLNSDPSHVLVERLVLPVLPQLLSLVIFSYRTKADPTLRQSAQDLIQIWIQITSSSSTEQPLDEQDSVVADRIRRAIRELEIGKELNLSLDLSSSVLNQWARDDDGLCCIKLVPNSLHQSDHHSLDFSIDIEALLLWFKSLNDHRINFLSILLAKWLDDVQILRNQPGFDQAKMTLFRIQVSLKILETFDPSKILKDPTQTLNFVHRSLIINDENEKKRRKKKDLKVDLYPTDSQKLGSKKQAMTLDSLKFLNLDHHRDGSDDQDPEEEDVDEEEEGDLDDGILMTGLTIFLTIIESNPDMNELNTPILKEISSRLDEVLLLKKTSSTEIYDLGIKVKLTISIRKALAQVDNFDNNDVEIKEREVEKEIKSLENQFIEGLKLIESDCIPIRSQGILILKRVLLTKDNATTNDQKKEKLNSWASQIIPILLRLIEEEDSFIYLNSIKTLSSLAEKYHEMVCFHLNFGFSGRYQDNNDKNRINEGLCRESSSLDRRLRIGEAIVQVVQRAGSALPIYIDKLLPSLLIVLNSRSTQANQKDIIKLKSSTLSILATCIETSFLTMFPYLSDLIQSCLTILNSPVSLPPSAQEDQDEEEGSWDQEKHQSSSFNKSKTQISREDDDVDLSSHIDADMDGLESKGKNTRRSSNRSADDSPTKNPRGPPLTETNMLKRAAMYLVDGLLNQIYQICSASASSHSPHSNSIVLIKRIQTELKKDLLDLDRVLNYYHHSCTSNHGLFGLNQSDHVLFSLLQNSLDCVAFLLRFLSTTLFFL